MSQMLEKVIGTEVRPSLDELAATIGREHKLALEAGQAMVEHAIRAAEALLEAHAQIPHGEWTAWVDQNCKLRSPHILLYMRIARHKSFVRQSGATTIVAARDLLVGKPGAPKKNQCPPELVEQARRLVSAGVSPNDAGEVLGVSGNAVRNWTSANSKAAQKRAGLIKTRKRRAAQAALKRQERDRAAKKVGGNIGEAYSLVRKLAQELDRAIESVEPSEIRKALEIGLRRTHLAEDAISEAVRLS